MIELDKIYCEPCIETLRRMEDNSVDCVITSPPYFNLRCYTDDPREIGREVTPQEYIDNMIEIFREVYRVLKSGTVWVNIGDTYAGNKKDNSSTRQRTCRRTLMSNSMSTSSLRCFSTFSRCFMVIATP